MSSTPDEIRFRTKRLGVLVYRQKFTDRHGAEAYASTWYMRKTIAGVTKIFPLGVQKRKAESLAEEIESFLSIPSNTMDQAVATYNPRGKARAEHVATIGETLEAYMGALAIIGRNGKPVSESSAKGYRSFLLTFLRKVEAYRAGKPFDSFMGKHHVDFSPWLGLPTSFLTARAVMDFKLASVAIDPPEGETEPDEEELLVARITADTTLRNARAIFSAQALRYYREVRLQVADVRGFLEEPDFGAKKYFQILPPEVVDGIMRSSIVLRAHQQDAYRAFLLTMHAGLRASEALAFDPSWIRDNDEPTLYVTTKGKFNPKHGTGRKVILEPWVAAALRTLGPVQDPESLDVLTSWVKGQIPSEHRVSKPLHELRKCWVSMKAKTAGILAAQQQAGHRDPKTTTTSYADNMMADWLVPFWQEPPEVASAKVRARSA